MISSRLQKYFDEYALSHKNNVNLVIHKIAIPLIVFHTFAMLTWVHLFLFSFYTVTLAEFVTLLVSLFYFSLNAKYTLIMFVFIVFCIFIAHYTPVWLVWAIAIVSWIIQLLGHVVWEKSAPAFTKNFLQLLIGPLFVLDIFLR